MIVQVKDDYWAEQVEIHRLAATAWAARAEGRKDEALATMRSAADLEDPSERGDRCPRLASQHGGPTWMVGRVAYLHAACDALWKQERS